MGSASKDDGTQPLFRAVPMILRPLTFTLHCSFSNAVLQALLVLLRKKPPKGHKLLVIGTSSNQSVLDQMGLVDCFSKVMHVDTLTDGKHVR